MRTTVWLILLLTLPAPVDALAAARRSQRGVRRPRPSSTVARPSALQHEALRGPGLSSARPVGVIRHLTAGDKGKFSLRDGKTVIGGLGYSRAGNLVSLEHTVVEPAFRGRGVAKRLVAHAVDWARANGVKLVPACSFAVAEFAKHPEYADVLAP
jgi:predicted GNAT family acetyltransferase